MHPVLKGLAAAVVGVALGLFVTWFTVLRSGAALGGIGDGPWRTSLTVGSSQGGPYLRAFVAAHGLLALGRGETIYYTATTDSTGDTLRGDCTYQIAGRDPPARWWSITAYGADDFLIPSAMERYSASMNSVARAPDGSFTITVSRRGGGANWIATAPGAFSLVLRLYNPRADAMADPAHLKLPAIVKAACG